MKPLVWTVVSMAMPSLVSAADGAREQLERTKSLCRGYTEGFVHRALDLAYGKRINGPRGIEVLESVEAVANRTVHGEDRPWGYGSGIEDVAYRNSMLLFALCEAEAAAGEPLFAEMARRAFRGLTRIIHDGYRVRAASHCLLVCYVR